LRWAEWNGRFRDDVRRFWRGDGGMRGALATRLAGSSDLYEPSGRRPYHSINFITSHDGFTLGDLVTYADKHNEANGEGNRDGENQNHSANYGIEGPTDRRSIASLRSRQLRNFFTTLLISQGVPMILAGDECRRTQGGNNNAYCQDNAVSWFDWKLISQNVDLVRFVQALIAFRRSQPTVRRTNFLWGEPRGPGRLPDVSWFAADGGSIDWEENDHSLTVLLGAATEGELAAGHVERGAPTKSKSRSVLMMLHGGIQPRRFVVPAIARTIPWRLFVDTAAESPKDIYPDLDGPKAPGSGHMMLLDRSARVYISQT
jgi:glycogen operon protein